jgi:hypothetical protein
MLFFINTLDVLMSSSSVLAFLVDHEIDECGLYLNIGWCGGYCSVPSSRHGLSSRGGSAMRDWEARGLRLRVHPGMFPPRGRVLPFQCHSRHLLRILSQIFHLI